MEDLYNKMNTVTQRLVALTNAIDRTDSVLDSDFKEYVDGYVEGWYNRLDEILGKFEPGGGGDD